MSLMAGLAADVVLGDCVIIADEDRLGSQIQYATGVTSWDREHM